MASELLRGHRIRPIYGKPPPFTPAPAPEIAPLNPFPPADAIDCGQYKQSLALCGKMLKKNEDVAIVKALMGLTHYRMDQKKEALLLADEARAMRPTDLETLQALAHTYKPLQKRMSYTYLSLSLASCLLPPASCLPVSCLDCCLTYFFFSFLFFFLFSFSFLFLDDAIIEMYEIAAEAQPNNMETLAHLFMACVRARQFKKQQQASHPFL